MINVCFDVDIRCAFKVHRWYILRVHHTQAHLIVFNWLCVKFPFLISVLFALVMVNVYPA